MTSTSQVTLVTTVLNEGDSIAAWLDGVASQDRQPDEVIVVDAGSKDSTVDQLRAHPIKPVVLVVPGAGISAGRNAGIAAARHDTIAVTDAGTVPHCDWLAKLVAPLDADAQVDAVAGFFQPAGESSLEKVLAAVITPRLPEIDPGSFLPSSRSVAFRRAAWQRAGGYPEWLRWCEDLVFDMALVETGARIAMAPDARVDWYPRPTLRDYFKQYRHYARGDGHALLYLRRHLIRYSTYSVAAVALSSRRRWLQGLALAAFAARQRRYVWRLWDERPFASTGAMARWTLMVPVITVIGDVAKMTGYPQGRWERWRAGGPEGLAATEIKSYREVD